MLLLAPSLLVNVALADVPMAVFPNCGEDTLDQCPNDLQDDDWDQISWVPAASEGSVRSEELELGSGIACDVAFRYTSGRWDVPIAILDTGIEWHERSLVEKVLINTGELPLPQDAAGETRGTYDLDDNGIVNVSDYAWDARVLATAGQDEADGFLDASDLIHTFSDGTDDDGNGYPDDIAGWDFFAWDNDPWPHVRNNFSSHGTGVMEEAAQEGHDGGGIGVCPNCAILPLRTGDGIISDGDRVGLAIAYATDRGARVVGMALGSLTHTELTDAAIGYADDHGVVIVSVAGDENSYHHNFPAVRAPILYTHSIRANNADETGPEVFSFLSFFNCNNYGPRMDLVAPTYGCATGSTARISGAAGMVISAGLDEGIDLEPDEVRALLRTSADDVYLDAEDQAEARSYPSKPGWDAFYGYGRANVGRAVERVFQGDVPPIARIDGPEWYAFETGSVEVIGRVDAPRSSVASWTLQAGRGAEPEAWEQLAAGNAAVDGTIATVDLSGFETIVFGELRNEQVVDRMHRAHEPLVTLLLTVTDADGRVTQDRRGFWVHDDPDLLPGFPIRLDGSGEPSAQLVDLDGDAIFEIVVASATGRVHAYRGDGTELPGFPVATDPMPATVDHADAPSFADGHVPADAPEGILATVAVGDIDGDGLPEVVAPSLRGGVYAWNHDGTRVSGWPQRLQGREPEELVAGRTWDEGAAASPALGDVDGDGDLEVVVGGMDQRLYVFRGDGTLLDGYPLELCVPELCGNSGARILSSPALGDIDGDGDLDVAIGSNEVPQGAAGALYVVDLASAAVFDGFPLERDGLVNQSVLPVIGEGHPSSVALADVDGNGDLELFSNPMLGASGLIGHDGAEALDLSYVRDGWGSSGTVFDENAYVSMITNPAFGDLDQDGTPDPVLGGTGPFYAVSLIGTTVIEYEHMVAAWSGTNGAMFAGFPRQVDDVSFLVAPAVADVSGDGVPEVIYGSGGYFVYAWDREGRLAPGFPKFNGGWMLGGTGVGDIDGDGLVEIVTTTREGWLHAWRTQGRADQAVQWTSMRHDPANTGNFHTPIAAQLGPEEKGCCKRKSRPAEGDAAWLVFVVPLTLLRRIHGRSGAAEKKIV